MGNFYIGIGSNQGDRLANIRAAVSALRDCGELVIASSVYETEPMYETNQQRFLNMVCQIESELAAIELFEATKAIEVQIGRVETYKNGPRIIDLDLLFSPEETYKDEVLEIPHPKLSERAFVLIPLVEIAPALKLTHLSCSAAEALARLDQKLISEVKPFSRD